MVATLRERGGLHTEEDFARGLHNAEFVEPITLNWKGYDVYQCPPNGQGLLVLMILGMLGGLPSAPDGPDGVIRAHRHIEAARLAYRDRDAFLADPGAVDVPVKKLLSPEYLASQRALISDTAAMPKLPAPGESVLPPHKDTVYLCVVDKDGNACSFINSLFENFGSGILAHKSGVMLQNRGFGFRLERGHPNCIAGGKRPMHTIIPGMLMKDGRAVMPFGVMGGHYQPMGQSWFLTNFLEYGLGHPAVHRPVPHVPHRRTSADGAWRSRRTRPQAGGHGPYAGADRTPAWRRAGDLDRSSARLPRRRVGTAERRLGAGLLIMQPCDLTAVEARRLIGTKQLSSLGTAGKLHQPDRGRGPCGQRHGRPRLRPRAGGGEGGGCGGGAR